MADAGFFKGTSADQDRRFSDKERKLLKSMKFPPEFDKKVDLRKVNLDVIRPWVTKKVVELVGFEDEFVAEYAVSLLEDDSQPTPDPRKMQINLTGFLTNSTPTFMTDLWKLLLEAQDSPAGIPRTFVEAKKEEMRRAREGDTRAIEERDRRVRLDDVRERERDGRGRGRGRGRGGRGRGGGPGRDDRMDRQRDSGWGGRGGGRQRYRSPSRSRSPPPRRRTRTPSSARSSRSRSLSPRRRSSPYRRLSPPSRAHSRSRSPPPRISRSPPPRRPSPPYRRSRSPPPRRRRRRSPSYSPIPRDRDRDNRRGGKARDGRSPPPRRRRLSPSPMSPSPPPRRRRSPSPRRGRSPSPYGRRGVRRDVDLDAGSSRSPEGRRGGDGYRNRGGSRSPPSRSPSRDRSPRGRVNGGVSELKIKGQAERSRWNEDRNANSREERMDVDQAELLERRENELKEKALRNKVVRTRKGSGFAPQTDSS